MGTRQKGGEEASSKRPDSHSSRLVHIRYKDHVLFRNADGLLLDPPVREAIGWVIHETEEAIWLCIDRAVKPLPGEDPKRDTGLVILKSDILEKREVEEKWKS